MVDSLRKRSKSFTAASSFHSDKCSDKCLCVDSETPSLLVPNPLRFAHCRFPTHPSCVLGGKSKRRSHRRLEWSVEYRWTRYCACWIFESLVCPRINCRPRSIRGEDVIHHQHTRHHGFSRPENGIQLCESSRLGTGIRQGDHHRQLFTPDFGE